MSEKNKSEKNNLLENTSISNSPSSTGSKEGTGTIAGYMYSHAEGYNTIASGKASHSEGYSTRAIGMGSHAEGSASKAIGPNSHAEGLTATSSGNAAHSQGIHTSAAGCASHAEGSFTKANGANSHAEGCNTTANGDLSYASGLYTDTSDFQGAYIIGKFGKATHQYSWHLANGSSPSDTNLAARIEGSGTGVVDMGWLTGNFGYAEMFESSDSSPIDCGYFVTLQGSKIRKANTSDSFILGVTSANPAIIANAGELRWKNKYLTDEWGRILYETATIANVTDEAGNIILPEHRERRPILNPKWEKNREYTSRLQRPEWTPVTLKGRVLVRDNGQCAPNEYCRPNDDGIAVPSPNGCRVMERTGSNQIMIFIE
ncbi:hypothetical protein OXPF_28410 [Oxobacter pfennigii]|uniref:Peptidase G2 IMC autoproteolytic cleavage domain-containing protein n=1 Tax=Oxobacter pfennigii TaxID=36849 RepID=A0A0N8NSZ4_9CLOT|nr:peptidase G2 autoproteolytic cleavage domain-containing protein [Oxobacter pfennigii]KPU43400.1 hypothetical protein OXPF_28410 [Oxobacter pfennigii]